MRENKILWYLATAGMLWLLWAGTFDTTGRFDPVAQYDVVEYRIGVRLGVMVEETNATIDEQNRGMQSTVNSRKRRIKNRVAEHE